MDKPTVAAAVPAVPIRLKFSPELFQRTEMKAVAVPAITAVVAALLSKLGIPGQPEVSWELNGEAPATGRPLAIYANGRICRYSDELMLLLYSYVQGKVALPLDALTGLQAWLTSAPEPMVAEWLALLCGHTLGRNARLLLGEEHARAYCRALATATTGRIWDHVRLSRILVRALDLGISIADYATVAAALGGNNDDGAACETLISELSPDHIEIRIERSYLRELSIEDGALGPELFSFLREGLFRELGIAYPPFHIVPDDTLRPGGFVFSVNHLAGLPLIGLPQNRILVNDSADRLRLMGVAAEPAANPATYQPGALAPRDSKQLLETASLTTWDPFSFLILSLASELRSKSGSLVTQSLTELMLEQLGAAFPELEQATNTHLCLDQLTVVLRELVAEQVPIRNLRRILELLLEHEFFIQPGAPIAERLRYVRQGLADAIANKYRKGATALVVYLLDPAAEHRIAAGQDSPETDLAQQVVKAIRNELNQLPSTASWPLILVGEAVCTPLQTMIADELPRMRVVSYSQLPPDLNVQPVARIGLEG